MVLQNDNSASYQVKTDGKDMGKRPETKTWNCMPLFLPSGPSTYVRDMSLVLAGQTWFVILAYLDDICVLGRSTEEHKETIKAVLKQTLSKFWDTVELTLNILFFLSTKQMSLIFFQGNMIH